MNIKEFMSNYTNHPVLFIGTGMSLRYLDNSYTWDGLLSKIAIDLFGDDREYLNIKSRYCEDGRFQYEEIAEELQSKFDKVLENDPDGRFKEINDKFFENMRAGNTLSRFKIYISTLLSQLNYKDNSNTELSELKKARKNVGSIITTNYDKLAQDIFEFNPLIGNDILLSNPYGSVYKIHGCVDDPSKIIITKKDYEKFKEKYELIRAQLLSLFIHNPIIFLGYNVGDENIKEILKTIFTYVEQNSPSANKIRRNFLLVEYEPESNNEDIVEHDIDITGFSTIRINKIKIETLPAAKMAETFALTFMIAALYLFARYKASRLLIAVFFAFSMIANNVHYAVYQSWMTGINYWLMLKEVTEVGSAGASMLDKLWLPALWGVAEVVLFCSLAKFRRKTHFSADILFAFLMLMIFVRSFDTKQEHGISPKPTYSRIKANYFSFGYFVGRVLPYQLFDLSKIPVFKQPAPSKIGQGSIQNIVLIMGESESAAHLKLFGYGRETSPFLTRLSQADFKPIVKQSYSAGFMTAVSLPSFFNVIPHANGLEQISGGDTNMFRLAKEQGYETYFYSAQAENQMAILNLIGKKWIDHLIQPTQLGYGNGDNMPDEKLLPLFDKINLQQGRHFIVLHQRGSHAPYGALLQPQDKVFGEADIADKYDNTIHKTDQMIQTVFEQLQKQPDGNWLFAYTSDHGQYVRQDIYNQGTVQPDSYIVPLVLYSPDKAVQQAANQAFAPCEIAFHQQLSTFLIHTLGYDMPVSGCREGSVTGNLITGDAGSLNIRNGKAEYVYPQ